MHQLCEICLELDPISPHRWKSVTHESIKDMPSSCSICQLLLKMVDDAYVVSGDAMKGCKETGSLEIRGSYTYSSIRRMVELHFAGITKELGTLWVCRMRPLSTYLANALLPARLLPSASESPIKERPVKTISANQIRFWLRRCELLHRGTCTVRVSPNSTEQPLQIILVDVKRMRLQRSTLKQRYLALSYVWGGVESLKTTKATVSGLEREGALERQRDKLPAVIYDAIKLVRKMGKRYIWIDSLCIVQDDETSKHAQICAMDKIYANAVLTIAAMSTKTASEHLPGFGDRQSFERRLRLKRYGFSIESSTSTWPSLMVRETPYESRAWTLQERLLSRRCLYLMDEKVYFHCPKGLYDEVKPHVRVKIDDGDWHNGTRSIENALNPLLLLQRPTKSIDNAFTPYGFIPWPVGIEVYAALVGKYTRRNLTYPTDKLNAFEGISAAMKVACGDYFIAGLPESMIDAALLWGLEDKAYDKLQRNPEFPSWSWAGWSRAVNYPFISEAVLKRRLGFRPEITSIWVEDQTSLWQIRTDKLCVPPSASSEQDEVFFPAALGKYLTTTTLHFWTKVAGPTAFLLKNPGDGRSGVELYDNQGRRCGKVQDMIQYEDFVSDPDGVGEFIFLSNLLKVPSYNSVVIMLIQWKGEYAERVALAKIYRDAWEAANPTSKYIRLA